MLSFYILLHISVAIMTPKSIIILVNVPKWPMCIVYSYSVCMQGLNMRFWSWSLLEETCWDQCAFSLFPVSSFSMSVIF